MAERVNLDALEEAAFDEQLARYVSGLLPPDSRERWIASLAKGSILLAARCASSCFVDTDRLDAIVDAAVGDHSPEALLALVEIGKLEKAWSLFDEIINPTREHVESLRRSLGYDDARHAGELLARVPLEGKTGIRRLAPIVRALDARLLSNSTVRDWLAAATKVLLKAHRHNELKAVARKSPDLFLRAIGQDLVDYIDELVFESQHLESKVQRISLAIELTKLFKLSWPDMEREIVDTIVEDNAQARALPTRGKLLGIARNMLARVTLDKGDQVKLIRRLMGSPGVESLELAVWIAGDDLGGHAETIREGTRRFMANGMQDSRPDKVKDFLVQAGLLEEFPGAELLDTMVEGRVLRVQGGIAELALTDCKFPGRVDFRNSGFRGIQPNEVVTGRVIKVRDGCLFLLIDRRRKG